MNKRQLALLFICTLIPYTAGNTQLTLLPIDLKQRGALARPTAPIGYGPTSPVRK